MADAEKMALRQAWKDSLPKFSEECLILKSKAGALERMRFNSAWRYIDQRLEEQKAATGKARALALESATARGQHLSRRAVLSPDSILDGDAGVHPDT